MKTNITGKQIDKFAATISDLPNYWGDKFNWSYEKNKYISKVNGAFIAKKYKSIVELIEETKANVHIKPNTIVIEYKTGESIISRDILTDNFLLPLINCSVGFQSVQTN